MNKKHSLEDLRNLSQKHRTILLENNITNFFSLVQLGVLELKVLLDTTLNKATAILKEARENLPPFIIRPASMILEENKHKKFLSTNCKSIDYLLGGHGLESGSITEFYAAFGTGKSQLVFSCIVSALLKNKDFPVGGSVIVIDTQSTCSPERLKEILEFYTPFLHQNTTEQALKNVDIIRPFSSEEQRTILKLFLENEGSGHTKYTNSKKPLRLLVIDSLTALFRAEYIGRGTLSQKQQKMNEHLRDLIIFALKNDIPVLITNQIMNSPDLYTYGDIPTGGNVLAHASTFRIALQKRKNFRSAKMVDSSKLPSNEVMFKLGKRGVIEVDDPDLDPESYKNSIQLGLEPAKGKSYEDNLSESSIEGEDHISGYLGNTEEESSETQ